ncbi:glycosyltransferase [Labrys sp. 22185]|uniref:glycosyltransferase n=1 Tax=Labrys sp. 22185 TaxID=3453888 RepID=UPI003F82E354
MSDSLGTPIHARGIFNFTYGVVQILKKLGHRVTLLVEPPQTGLLASDRKVQRQINDLGTRRAYFADVMRHFEGDRFRFDWHYPDPSEQRLADEHPHLMDFRLAMLDTENARNQFLFSIEPDELSEYAPSSYSDHLRIFDGILTQRGVYSESFRRGYQNLRPVAIDATGFDHVIIDTPHYIQVSGVSSRDISYVIHDLIPFYEVSMGFDWRKLFVHKMECTMAVGRNAIYNSETTGKYFKRIYGNDAVDREITIYPPIREEVKQAALVGDRNAPSNYVRAIRRNKAKERKQWVIDILKKNPFSQTKKIFPLPSWNGNLPFFCSILSDEPRKNVAALVEASRSYVGKANFIVMGQIDGNRYMERRPGNFPNLHFTGYVSDVQKFDLLRSCEGFIFPSLNEGFGIPIVEAAAFGAPIICTDLEVFREITYDQAYYFDANKKGDLVRVIEQFRADPNSKQKGLSLKRLVNGAFNQDVMAERLATLLA